MAYLDFLLQIHSAGNGRFGISASSPAGEEHGELALAALPREWSREFPQCVLRDLAGGRRERVPAEPPQEIGARLYNSLLPPPVRSLFVRSYDIARQGDAGLRLKIFLNPREPALRTFQSYPWELLYRDDLSEFLSLSRWTPVVRCLPVARPVRDGELPRRVRVLAVLAAPRDAPALELHRELVGMKSAEARGRFEILPWKARLSELRAQLGECGPFHALHFLGHGTLLPGSGEGALLFENENGARDTVPAVTLFEKLRDFPSLRLLILNACRSGQYSAASPGSPFSSVAAALVQAGFPAVLAMQETISDQAAIALSGTLYRKLAMGEPLEAAMAEARQAVFDLNTRGFDWIIPSLFLRSSSAPPPGREENPSGGCEAAVELFQSGRYSLARQRSREALAHDPGDEKAKLYDHLARMACGNLSVKDIGEIDDGLQSLLGAADPEAARLARLALGILRADAVEPRRIVVRGIPSGRLFAQLEGSQRTPSERDLARALAASRDAMVLFNLLT